MIYLYIRHTVGDFAQWKETFDMQQPTRQAGGATAEAIVFQHLTNPQHIVLLLGWHDLAQAKRFIRSVSWQMTMGKMGIIGRPEVRFLEKV